MPAKKSGGRKYGRAAGKQVKSAMHRAKKGTLKSGRGGKGGTVKSRKQAIAIGLSEARKKGRQGPQKEELTTAQTAVIPLRSGRLTPHLGHSASQHPCRVRLGYLPSQPFSAHRGLR